LIRKPEVEPNFSQIPRDLQKLNRWMLWRLEDRGESKKPTKVPYRVDGSHARVSDPATWASFEEAYSGYNSDSNTAGVGLVLGEIGDGRWLSGMDIDRCRDPGTGRVAQWALDFINRAETYTEVSPSGTGVKLVMWGRKPEHAKCRTAVNSETGKPDREGQSEVELYDFGRYFALTGEVFNGRRSLGDGTKFLSWAVDRLGLKRQPQPSVGAASLATGAGIEDDDLLLAEARKSKKGKRFSELFDTDKYAGPGNSEARGELLLELAFWTGGNPEQMARLFARSQMDQCEDKGTRGGESFISYEIEKAIRKSEGSYTGHLSRGAMLARAKVRIVKSCDLEIMVAEACSAISKVDPPIVFEDADRLVELPKPRDADPGMIGSERFISPREVTRHRMPTIISSCSEWYKPATEDSDEKRTPVPTYVCDAVRAAPPSWAAPLRAVLQCPIARPDGTFCFTPGYDRVSAGYFDDTGISGISSPKSTGLREAKDAIKTLCYPISEFPWVSDTDKSSAIAMLLTMVGRTSIKGNVPAFLVGSNAAGTGKSKLANWAISTFMRGRPCRATQSDPDELRKVLVSAMKLGNPVMLLDNISGEFASAALDAFITGDGGGRELGKSTIIEKDFSSVIIMTGNNIRISGDLGRRIIPVILDAKMERPETRSGFEIEDLTGWVSEHRQELLMAAMTVLMSYRESGEDRHSLGIEDMGSFEGWSDLVRGALVWCGLADPYEGQKDFRESQDVGEEEASDVISAIYEATKGAPFTVSELVDMATDSTTDAAKRGELGDALTSICGGRRSLTAKPIASFMKSIRGRPIGGLIATQMKRTARRRPWTVDVMKGS
jgi:hypothetical protein